MASLFQLGRFFVHNGGLVLGLEHHKNSWTNLLWSNWVICKQKKQLHMIYKPFYNNPFHQAHQFILQTLLLYFV
jgi:hypothetical protein